MPPLQAQSVEKAARALANAVLDHSVNQGLALQGGAVPVLARLLRSRNSSVVRAALAAVANLALRNPAAQDRLLECSGLVAALVTCLKYKNVAVQERAALAVANLSWSHVAAQAALAEGGCLPALVRLLGCGSTQVGGWGGRVDMWPVWFGQADQLPE